MFKRNFPSLEDNGATAGGDTIGDVLPPQALGRGNLPSGTFREPGSPPPGNGSGSLSEPSEAEPPEQQLAPDGTDEMENYADDDMNDMLEPDEEEEETYDFLGLVREAQSQSRQYLQQINRKSWAQAFRAVHNEHFSGSKYTSSDYKARSKIFRPKTRSAVRKDQAAVVASLFGNIDAINCIPGDEANPMQRGAASVMEQLVNYRTDRTSGRAALPWFAVAVGARQDALTTGICVSKQSWKLDLRKERVTEIDQATGQKVIRDVYRPDVDRPDCQLIPPENVDIDPAADWTDPIQSSAYVLIRWPMQLDEVRTKQKNPLNPWNEVEESILFAAAEDVSMDVSSLRTAREGSSDRYKQSQGQHFRIVWITEVYMRVGGTDYTFLSIGDKAYLTDPKPTREVYPEQDGERPLVMGYGSIEAHRVFPMSPVESWQPMQMEINDLVNLSLDILKQNAMPVSKVRRGRQIDLDQVRRRASGSSIMVSQPDDVTWEKVPDVPQSMPMVMRDIELEMDDLAGQFNAQSVEHNNAVSRTLGGLKLVSGSANAVQEMDIRVWIETWTNPALAQLVRLEQWYEHDPIVLGLCGARAKLFQKHGIDQINDDLLSQEVTIRVNVGLGAGDPAARLQRFQMAAQTAMPVLQQSKKFISGELEIDEMAVMEEVFGAAGYRDGGRRFIRQGQPQQGGDPLLDLKAKKLQSDITKNDRTGRSALLSGLAAVAKVALGSKDSEAEQTNRMLDIDLQHRQQSANEADMGHRHAMEHRGAQREDSAHQLAAQQQTHQQGMDQRTADAGDRDAGHAAGMDVAGHQHEQRKTKNDLGMQMLQMAQPQGGDDEEGGGAPAPAPAAPGPGPAAPPPMAAAPSAPPAPAPQPGAAPPAPGPIVVPPPEPAPAPVRYDFIRDPKSGRIVGAVPIYAQKQPPGPAGPPAHEDMPWPPPVT
jgi:hypothetical protein